MNTHYAATTADSRVAPDLRNKAEFALWILGMVVALAYVALH